MRVALLCGISFMACFGLGRWIAAPSQPPLVRSATAAVGANPARSDVQPDLPPTSAEHAQANRRRLTEALAGDDPLASAGPTLAWIKAATLEDFRNLAANPEKFPFPVFSGFQQEFRSGFFDALVDRWLRLDPDGAGEAMARVQDFWTKRDSYSHSKSHDLYMAAARVRPEWLLGRIPLEDEDGSMEWHAASALTTLAARDSKSARTFLSRFSGPKTRRAAELAIARGIAQSDPLEGVALARQMNDDDLFHAALASAEKIGPGMVRQVVLAADGKLDNSQRLPTLLLRDPDLAADLEGAKGYKTPYGMPQGLMEVARDITPEERARILAGYAALPEGLRDDIGAALGSSWARTEPRKAAEWALAQARPEDRNHTANRAADQVFLRWVNNDVAGALEWWRSLPASPLRDALGTSASTFIAERGDLDAALELFRPGPAKSDEDATAHLSQFLTDHDPAKAAAWLRELPAGTPAARAVQHVVQEWYARDPEAVAQYVEELPNGTLRDQALNSFITEAAQQSPSGAAEWVQTVVDPKLRQQAASQVHWRWSMHDPAAAQEWMRTLSGVDREWHDRIVRRMR